MAFVIDTKTQEDGELEHAEMLKQLPVKYPELHLKNPTDGSLAIANANGCVFAKYADGSQFRTCDLETHIAVLTNLLAQARNYFGDDWGKP